MQAAAAPVSPPPTLRSLPLSPLEPSANQFYNGSHGEDGGEPEQPEPETDNNQSDCDASSGPPGLLSDSDAPTLEWGQKQQSLNSDSSDNEAFIGGGTGSAQETAALKNISKKCRYTKKTTVTTTRTLSSTKAEIAEEAKKPETRPTTRKPAAKTPKTATAEKKPKAVKDAEKEPEAIFGSGSDSGYYGLGLLGSSSGGSGSGSGWDNVGRFTPQPALVGLPSLPTLPQCLDPFAGLQVPSRPFGAPLPEVHTLEDMMSWSHDYNDMFQELLPTGAMQLLYKRLDEGSYSTAFSGVDSPGTVCHPACSSHFVFRSDVISALLMLLVVVSCLG